MNAIAPGWYKDPADPATQRWWDGEGWIGDAIPADATPPAGPPPVTTPPAASVATAPSGTGAAPPSAGAARRRWRDRGRRHLPPAVAVLAADRARWYERSRAGRARAVATRRPRAVAGRYPFPAPAPRPHGLMLASSGSRLVARLVDIVAVLILSVIANAWFAVQFWRDFQPYFTDYLRWAEGTTNPFALDGAPAPPSPCTLLLLMCVVITAVWFAYEVPASANTGQTLGKRLLGIKVVRVETDERLGFGRALRRWSRLGLPTLLWPLCYGLTAMLQVDRLPLRGHRPAAAPGPARQGRAHGRGPGASAWPSGDRANARNRRTSPPLEAAMLTRADLDALPAYVPGRTVPGRDQAGQQRGAVRPAARRGRGGRRGRRGVPPLPGHGRGGAAGARSPSGSAWRRTGSPPAAARSAWPSTWPPATCHAGDEILYSWRSFEAYPIIAATTGATSVRVPNTAEHGHDLPAMAAAVTDRTRLVLVCNPNNPTGTAVRTAELTAFLDAVPGRRAGRARRGVPRVRHRPRRARRPGHLRRPAQRGGAAHAVQGLGPGRPAGRLPGRPAGGGRRRPQGGHAVLHLRARPGRRARRAAAPRTRCAGGRAGGRRAGPGGGRAYGHGCPTCRRRQANFVWLPLGDRAADFAAACEAAGVIVRPFAGDGVRVTIGTPEENDAFLAAAEKFFARAWPLRDRAERGLTRADRQPAKHARQLDPGTGLALQAANLPGHTGSLVGVYSSTSATGRGP